MIYSNYRNNMPHYDSITNNYDPRGINDYKVSQNSRLSITNTMPTMPGMPVSILDQRPFIPDSEIPFEIDGNMPALPRTPDTRLPGAPQQSMPQMPGMPQPSMPQQGMPQMPRMPQMPGMQQPAMTPDGNMYPTMPGMPGGMPNMTCDQLREMMRRMNCPMSETPITRPVVPPENGTTQTPQSVTQPRNNNR